VHVPSWTVYESGNVHVSPVGVPHSHVEQVSAGAVRPAFPRYADVGNALGHDGSVAGAPEKSAK
jgi:hypothetical protein